MNAPDIQHRGNCQVCGRLHAVVKGKVAKHGYTVKDGWFEGACNGQFYAPMQHSTEKATLSSTANSKLKSFAPS